jgi:adenylate cyclase
MYPTTGHENPAKKNRFAQRDAAGAILRRWRRGSEPPSTVGETRELSFLTCRIRDFDRLVAAHAADPEGLCYLVRRAATILADTVRAHGGIVDREFAGGLSAFFGGLRESGEHAVKTCACALAMVAAAEKWNSNAGGAAPLAINIGIETGPAILGDFGTQETPHLAAVGLPAERADSLARLCGPCGMTILTGPGIAKQAERSFAFLQVDRRADADGATSAMCALLGPPLSHGNPKFVALKSFHTHIFDALVARNWKQARNLVIQCRALSQANPVLYDLYLQRIAEFQANPPPEPWNGTLLPAQI